MSPQATWLVHRELMQKLREMSWKDGMTMLDFYETYYVPFGELLTDMERCVRETYLDALPSLLVAVVVVVVVARCIGGRLCSITLRVHFEAASSGPKKAASS